jgi:chemotaxis protein histidine kinase CheA
MASWDHLHKLVGTLSSEYQKDVILVPTGLGETNIPSGLQQTINRLCIQFLRNSVVHGIEPPEERKAAEKSQDGRIDIRLSKTPKGILELVVRDDGAGFNYEKIRQKAIDSGKWSETEIESWDNKQLLSLIFSPGFSTAEKVDKNAGRGIGMDAVLKNVKEHRGKITISSQPGRYSQFVVTFPLDLEQKVAA